ncbi:hypothetical protein DNU06_06100 [Putridiphycobacter roseus]|uniref:DUF4199 domain-containing protein n=1 Tax=Putridiphycobacter roseus TaxID=2219161 RepID=A0A2W1NGF7_9FLAO|nr:DUF4199 family protein [Putridiphycobacter roseus]PZE18183.1 hypothetical protein DNU06_06100 [Putridiphycobacter roseus]
MKIPLRVAMVCFLISVGITFGFYFADASALGTNISGLYNMFLLLSAIAVSLYIVKRSQNFSTASSFAEDFKVAVQGGLVFVILLSLFTYVYHDKIDDTFIASKLNERLDANLENVPDEATFKKLQAEDFTWKNKTYLDYIENQEDQAYVGLSAYSYALGHLGIGLFLTMFFSIAITFIWRSIVMLESRKK